MTAIEQDIRALRKAAGLSQEKLARLAGVSTSTVALQEAGYRSSTGHSPARERILAALRNGEERVPRVIVLTDDDGEVDAFAVPADWDTDDVDRFVKDREPYWVSAAVVTVQSVDAEAS